MDAREWLVENGIDPESVSDTLIQMLQACNDPKCREVFRFALMVTEPCGDDD